MDRVTGPLPDSPFPPGADAVPADAAAPRGAPDAAVRPLSPASANRLIALAIFVPAFALLLVAAWLTPDASGSGTHEQLGLDPCGFLVATGLPCATCGMTTAFSHAADGNLLASYRVQPAGAVLALLTAVAAVVSGYAAVTGASLAPVGRALGRPRTFIALGVLIALGWAYTLTLAILG